MGVAKSLNRRGCQMGLVLVAGLLALIFSGCAPVLRQGSSDVAMAQANLGYGQPLVAVGDVTGDGWQDIVFGDKDGIKLLVNQGYGKFSVPLIIGSVNLGYGQPSVAIGDVTGDGLADVIVGDKNGIVVLKNLGVGGNKFEVLRP